MNNPLDKAFAKGMIAGLAIILAGLILATVVHYAAIGWWSQLGR